jgi:hypothetical protein
MFKTASTSTIIKMLRDYEFLFGKGFLTSFEERDDTFIMRVVNKNGNPHVFYLPKAEVHTVVEDT